MLDTVSFLSEEKPIVKYKDYAIYQQTFNNGDIEYYVFDGEFEPLRTKKLASCIDYLFDGDDSLLNDLAVCDYCGAEIDIENGVTEWTGYYICDSDSCGWTDELGERYMHMI